VVEVLHSIGLCFLVFQLLPNLGPVRGACVLSATAIIPSFLKLFYTKDQRNDGIRKRIALFVLNMLAFFFQLSVLPFILLPGIQYLHGYRTSTETVNLDHDAVNISKEWQITTVKGCKIVLSLLLTSVVWWENFVDKINGTGKMKQFLLKTKYQIDESRSYIYIFVSVSKIATSVVATQLLAENSFTVYSQEFWGALSNQNLTDYTDILCLIGSAFLGYYIAYIACKLKMQIFSFSLPCLLSTPLSVVLLTMYCQNDDDFLSNVLSFESTPERHTPIYNPWYHVTMTSLWLLSLYWVAQHIWFPREERLAKLKR
jgi:chitin synthase